jgi:hypothetical protein
MGIPAHEHGLEARDTENMGKDAHATDPAQGGRRGSRRLRITRNQIEIIARQRNPHKKARFSRNTDY